MGAITHNGEVLQRLPASASQINFDNTGTDLNSTQTENAIKEVNTKANTLQSEKTDTDIVASDFDATASYTAGNYCIYNGKFYKFKANHTGAWSAADVDEIKIAGELSSLNSKFTTLQNKAMNPKSTTTLGTILVAENTKTVRATVNGFISVQTNNVGGTTPTVSCMARNMAQDIGAAATYTLPAYTGAYLICVPVNAGEDVVINLSGHTVDASIMQTGTTPS